MPFSFQLLVEFVFPGLILFCAFVLSIDYIFPAEVNAFYASLVSGKSTNVAAVVFIAGLVCYFFGTTINAVSNRLIRIWGARYRRKMIRRKLGLGDNATFKDIDCKERQLYDRYLPTLKSEDDSDDKFNELYAAARTFCSLHSDRTVKAIDYHWSQVRLSRATLLPLALLTAVFLIRALIHDALTVNILGFGLGLFLFVLTLITYRYREKFLVYTVFNVFFGSAKGNEMVRFHSEVKD